MGTGEIYGFLGPNGAGKSTVVRMLSALLGLSGGRASVAGYNICLASEQVGADRGRPPRSGPGRSETGRELLSLQGRLYGLGRRRIEGRIDEVLDLVDIGSAIDRRIGTY